MGGISQRFLPLFEFWEIAIDRVSDFTNSLQLPGTSGPICFCCPAIARNKRSLAALTHNRTMMQRGLECCYHQIEDDALSKYCPFTLLTRGQTFRW